MSYIQSINYLDGRVLQQLGAPSPLPESLHDSDGDLHDWAQEAIDAAKHGADGGFSGFIYYRETVEFCAANWSDITVALYKDAESSGVTVAEMVAGFGRSDFAALEVEHLMLQCSSVAASVPSTEVHDDDRIDDDHISLMNLLSWYALESTGRKLLDLLDE